MTALAIGIQNVPEGFAAAAPLLAAGTSDAEPSASQRSVALLIGFALTLALDNVFGS